MVSDGRSVHDLSTCLGLVAMWPARLGRLRRKKFSVACNRLGAVRLEQWVVSIEMPSLNFLPLQWCVRVVCP